MGMFDKEIKTEQNRTDTKETERIRKLEEKETEQRLHAETAEKLVPYVRTALEEFPDACRKLDCEYLTIFVKRKRTFFNRSDYEKWNGIPVTKAPYANYLVFIHDGKYYINLKDPDHYHWDHATGIPVHLNKPGVPRLSIYTDMFPELTETTIDEAAQMIADWAALRIRNKETAEAKGSTMDIIAAVKGTLDYDLAVLMNDAYKAYKEQDYEKTVRSFFMCSFRIMKATKDSWLNKKIQEY